MHNPNNYLTVLTETEWFFTVSSELWKPKSVETICLLKKINIKNIFGQIAKFSSVCEVGASDIQEQLYLTALTMTVSWKLENQNRLRLSVC